MSNITLSNDTLSYRTCGVSDGGLHNMFLGADQIWLFDLGEPKLGVFKLYTYFCYVPIILYAQLMCFVVI